VALREEVDQWIASRAKRVALAYAHDAAPDCAVCARLAAGVQKLQQDMASLVAQRSEHMERAHEHQSAAVAIMSGSRPAA